MNVKYNSLGIHIKAKDIRDSVNFYSDLGMKPVFAYGSMEFLTSLPDGIPTAPESYNGAIFAVGEGLLEVADGHMAVNPDVFKQEISSSKVSAMIKVKSVKDIVTTATANNISIAVPIREFPWGTREVVIKDPDGFVLVFVEQLSQQ
ncbi:VOC family protein [candidate division WWE3 bacterium]|uniref:VOC family protein n=1 Tax=candidate division WWE3 bacterium TaxID=2053526 RepID=A0A955LKU8_UNCKA|nr:VOC family protein [candidate division WWE3 bacterium]